MAAASAGNTWVGSPWRAAGLIAAVEGLALLAAGLPPLQFPGSPPPVAAEFRDQRDHAGVDAGHQPIGFLALGVAHQQSAGTAGDIGHFRAPLVEDQAGAQPVPAFLQRRDARVAAAGFEGD